jgi:predicted DsbA family dithiol-disulfide isomerase
MNKYENTVIIAHDYLCPWCWIGFFHAKLLKEEFSEIKQIWRGYELLPESLGPLPEYKPRIYDANAPKTRLDILAERDNIPIPRNRTIGAVRTRNALMGAEYFQDRKPELFDHYNEAVYRAYWEYSQDISDLDTLCKLASEAGADPSDFLEGLTNNTYAGKIVEFNDAAYADDVTHVPTFIFRGERCAEAPYDTIRDQAKRFVAWYIGEQIPAPGQKKDADHCEILMLPTSR